MRKGLLLVSHLLLCLPTTWAFLPCPAKPATRPSPVPSVRAAAPTLSSSSSSYEFALLFDCDGVILETEELHRLAYNAAFAEFDLIFEDGTPVEWTEDYYDVLQNTVGGGKPKMWHYFTKTMDNTWPQVGKDEHKQAPPATRDAQQALIDTLQEWKTQHYKKLLQTQAVPRPGVLALLDQALADPNIAVGVCSAATKEAAQQTLSLTLGDDRVAQLDVCLLGDDVSAKKPDPLIYITAAERIGIDSDRCVVVEDSLIGVQAAVAAGMNCIVTYTSSTAAVDFYAHGAKAKMPNLEAGGGVTLEALFGPLRQEGLDADLLVNIRDPVQQTTTRNLL